MIAPTRFAPLAALACSLALASGCSKDGTAQAAAETFLDKYYIEIDRPAALKVATGAAADRVQTEEKDLTAARRMGVSREGQVTPSIYYKKQSEVLQPDGSTLLRYHLTIDSQGIRLAKDVALSVVKQGEHFRVTAFTEADVPTAG